MTKQLKPIIHARDHLPDGADPIPGLQVGGSYTDAVLAETSLWAYWPLQDASGNLEEVVAGRDMTAIESSTPGLYAFTYQQPGPTDDFSLEFVGKDTGLANMEGTLGRYDLVAGDDTELYGSDGFTVELWFWAADPAVSTQLGGPDYNGVLVSQGSSVTDSNEWELSLDATGNLQFVVGGTITASGPGGSPDLVLTAVPTVPETWVHVAVTYDNTTAKLYVDGGLADSGAVATFGPAARIQIGRQVADAGTTGQYSRYLEGRMAHVALYTGGLDATAIAGHAELTGGGTVGPPGPTGPTGPAGPGVPTGGTAGQVLTKDTGTDYDTSWQTPAAGGDPADDTAVWMPLSTVSAGVPDLVWDGDDNLIPTLTPI